MPDPSDGTDIDSSFATPQELAFRRGYAKSLIEQAQGNIPGPAVSPFQGIGGVVQALAGRRMLDNAAQAERYNNAQAAKQSPGAPGGDVGGGPLSATPPGQVMGYSDDVSKLMPAIASEEGTGSYNQLGNPTKDGDRAYGKYQVMGKNIGPWSQEILGTPLTPEQFLNNPSAQEAVAKAKLSEYNTKYGPVGAAKAWFAGPGGMNNPNATDVNGTSVGQYGANVSKALGFSGDPASAPTGAADTGSAPGAGGVGPLAYKPPMGPSGGLPGPSMAPAGMGAADQPSGTLPTRPQVTRQQFEATMANPNASPEQKQAVWGMYYGQNQPLQVQGPYGSTIVVNPRDPSQRWVLPPALQAGTKTVGPITKPTFNAIIPPGSSVGPPNIQTITPGAAPGPQSSAAPASGPAPAAPGQPATRSASASTLDSVPPTLTSEEQKAVETGEPLKYAEADTGVKTDGLPPEITQGKSAPVQPVAAEGPLAVPPPGSPGVRTTQAGPAPDVDAGDAADLQYLQNMDVTKAAREKGNELSLANADKYYTGVSDQAQQAAANSAQYDEASKIVNSPDFYSGIGSGVVQFIKRAKTALGGDPAAAGAMDTFEKLRNSLNLGSLRTQLGGLGQIRLAEVNMVDRANANLDNSVAANKALVLMGQAINNRVIQAGQMANDYVAAHGGVADQTLRNRLFNYYKNQPLMSDDQIKQFDNLITTEATRNKQGAGPLVNSPPGASTSKAPAPPPGFK